MRRFVFGDSIRAESWKTNGNWLKNGQNNVPSASTKARGGQIQPFPVEHQSRSVELEGHSVRGQVKGMYRWMETLEQRPCVGLAECLAKCKRPDPQCPEGKQKLLKYFNQSGKLVGINVLGKPFWDRVENGLESGQTDLRKVGQLNCDNPDKDLQWSVAVTVSYRNEWRENRRLVWPKAGKSHVKNNFRILS